MTGFEEFLLLTYELQWHRSVGLATEEYEDEVNDKLEAMWYNLLDEDVEAMGHVTKRLADVYAAAKEKGLVK